MYEAVEHQVFYTDPETDKRELFLTVHPTVATKTLHEQACVIADMLNGIHMALYRRRS